MLEISRGRPVLLALSLLGLALCGAQAEAPSADEKAAAKPADRPLLEVTPAPRNATVPEGAETAPPEPKPVEKLARSWGILEGDAIACDLDQDLLDRYRQRAMRALRAKVSDEAEWDRVRELYRASSNVSESIQSSRPGECHKVVVDFFRKGSPIWVPAEPDP